MQEEVNSILYQRRQNIWSNKSFHTLKLLSKRMQQIRKCHSFHVHVVVEFVKTLEAAWCLHIYVCVCVCVFVWCPLSLCGFVSRSGLFVSLYDTHEAEPLGRS